MTTNAAASDLTFLHARRTAVRTARAIVGLAQHERVVVTSFDRLKNGQASCHIGYLAQLQQPGSKRQRHVVRIHFAVYREQRLPVFCVLAHDARMIRHAVEAFAQLIFNKAAFFLDDDNFLKPGGKAAHDLVIDRIRHA